MSKKQSLQDQLNQLKVILNDQKLRLNHLYTIRNKQVQCVKFHMNGAQEKLFDEMHYLNVVLKARQLGFSTLIDLFLLDTCLFNPNIKAGVIAHHIDDAKAIFQEKIKYPYDQLPDLIKNQVQASTDRVDEIQFSNGSSIRVSTSFRSGTLNILHVSEYGKIAAKYPDKAKEIKTGAFEAVAQGQMIFVESTAEGREGEFFDLCERSRRAKDQGKKLGKLDFKFFFFPWWENPEYVAESTTLNNEHLKYFEQLENREIKLSLPQKYWYAKKLETLQDDMRREHPSFPEEAFDASIEGAYYASQMARMRREGRIGVVPYESMYPVDTFWDLGMDDSTSIWFVQSIGQTKRLIDYYESSGEGLEHYANVLKKKKYTYGTHYMPHDIAVKELGTGKTRRQKAMLLGISPITVSRRPRNTDALMEQIEMVRSFLSSVYIDEEKCSQGIKCLDSYRKEWDDRLGAYKRTPRHDWSSHGADALRTGAVQYQPERIARSMDMLPEAFAD